MYCDIGTPMDRAAPETSRTSLWYMHWPSNQMEEYGRRNKIPATESQNKPEMRNTTCADNHSCRRRSSGGGWGRTYLGRSHKWLSLKGRSRIHKFKYLSSWHNCGLVGSTANGKTKYGKATRSTGPHTAITAAVTHCIIVSLMNWENLVQVAELLIGSLRYRDYGLWTTAGRALSFVRSTGLSRANIER